jgi:membrane associated rhomboid family serine protease
MILLLASLAWAQAPPEDSFMGPGGRIVLGTLEGALIGGAVGAAAGLGIAAAVAQGWENDDCTDCDRSAFVFIPGGALVGIVPGAIAGGVIAANKAKRRQWSVTPTGPGGTHGVTLAGKF